MNFTYSAAQLELKKRARGLARAIMTFEEQCDVEDGLPDRGARGHSPRARSQPV